jgi:hypothetical protein
MNILAPAPPTQEEGGGAGARDYEWRGKVNSQYLITDLPGICMPVGAGFKLVRTEHECEKRNSRWPRLRPSIACSAQGGGAKSTSAPFTDRE